ncbi:MAG: EVE domain-containing protein [Oceanospirillaceae bacterium]
MANWLLKTEPSDYSIDDLATDKVTPWGGIRNFQARNFIRDKMVIGDNVLIYHSSCKQVGVAGIAQIISDAYADPEQFDASHKYYDAKSSLEQPKWHVVDVKFVSSAQQLLPLKAMKAAAELEDLALFKQSRLSIVPVSDEQWDYIVSKIS